MRIYTTEEVNEDLEASGSDVRIKQDIHFTMLYSEYLDSDLSADCEEFIDFAIACAIPHLDAEPTESICIYGCKEKVDFSGTNSLLDACSHSVKLTYGVSEEFVGSDIINSLFSEMASEGYAWAVAITAVDGVFMHRDFLYVLPANKLN